mmetsp:Transcript_42900/g.100690  ORF Transcript_42900/g.100690 Transcript_42900/m.100690 type:complete len:268 (-) Transcript_42900:327-1130(-)
MLSGPSTAPTHAGPPDPLGPQQSSQCRQLLADTRQTCKTGVWQCIHPPGLLRRLPPMSHDPQRPTVGQSAVVAMPPLAIRSMLWQAALQMQASCRWLLLEVDPEHAVESPGPPLLPLPEPDGKVSGLLCGMLRSLSHELYRHAAPRQIQLQTLAPPPATVPAQRSSETMLVCSPRRGHLEEMLHAYQRLPARAKQSGCRSRRILQVQIRPFQCVAGKRGESIEAEPRVHSLLLPAILQCHHLATSAAALRLALAAPRSSAALAAKPV